MLSVIGQAKRAERVRAKRAVEVRASVSRFARSFLQLESVLLGDVLSG